MLLTLSDYICIFTIAKTFPKIEVLHLSKYRHLYPYFHVSKEKRYDLLYKNFATIFDSSS